MNPRDFENSMQQLDLFEYFEGKTRAWGIFEDRFNRLRRQFTVDIHGVVNGDTLVLEEYFTYADGEQQERIWTIRRLGNNRYSGTADDVIGEATRRNVWQCLALELSTRSQGWQQKCESCLRRLDVPATGRRIDESCPDRKIRHWTWYSHTGIHEILAGEDSRRSSQPMRGR